MVEQVIKCPDRTTLMIPERLAGKQVKCPKCRGIFVPQAQPQNVVAALQIKLYDDLDMSTYARPNTKMMPSLRCQESGSC
jgi:hypothetical protein